MQVRLVGSLLLCLAVSVAGPVQAESPKEIEKQLTDELKGQVVTLRTPVRGSELKFDREGGALKGSDKGPWTLYSRVEVGKVIVKKGTLRIEGVRLYVGFGDEKQEFTHYRSPDKVRIDIETGKKEVDSVSARVALARVFITQDELSDGDIFKRLIEYFRSSKDSSNADPEMRQARMAVESQEELLKRSVTTPPECEDCPYPEFSPEARRFRHDGRVVLWCFIDSEGRAAIVRVQKALGMGLDEKAVEAVKKWRFKPAMRDGQPIGVYLAIEVNFHLVKTP